MISGLPPCVVKQYAVAYEQCVPAPAAADAPAATRTKAFVDRAVVLVYLHRWEEAVQAIDSAIASGGGSSVETLHFASRLALSAWMARSQPSLLDKARSYSASALQLAPDESDVQATRAFLIEKTGSADAAIAAYGSIITARPDHAFALERRGMLQARLGKFEAAIVDLGAAIEILPDKHQLRRERAKLYGNVAKPREALADLTFVLDKNPQDILAIAARSTFHRQLGDNEAALEDINSLVYGPKGGLPFAFGHDQLAGFLMQRAVVLADLRRHEEAADDMVRAVKLGGKRKILRLQVYLRQNGFDALPLDGVPSEALIEATRACFVELKCKQGITRAA